MKRLFVFALTALSLPAFAAFEPLQAGPAASGAPVEIFINKDSVKKDDNLELVWAMFAFKIPQREKSQPSLTFQSATARLAFNCKEHTYALRAEKHYEGEKRQGKVIYDYVVPADKVVFAPVQPGTSSAAEEAIACTAPAKKSE